MEGRSTWCRRSSRKGRRWSIASSVGICSSMRSRSAAEEAPSSMNWDMPVLVGSLLAIVVSFVWSRATIVGPVLFAWAGAAAGGTVAFVRHYDMANDQVGIDHIVPLAAFG